MLRRHPQLDFLEGPRRKKYKYGALAFIPKFRVHNIQALEALLKTMYEGKHENGSERGMKLDHLKVSPTSPSTPLPPVATAHNTGTIAAPPPSLRAPWLSCGGQMAWNSISPLI